MSEKEQQSLELLAHRIGALETVVKDLAVVVRGNGKTDGTDLRSQVLAIQHTLKTERSGRADLISRLSGAASLIAILTFLLTHFSKGRLI